MKRLAIFLYTFCVILAAHAITEEQATEYLIQHSPLADRLTHPREYFAAGARHALLTRTATPWGPAIPDDIFLHYVLPLRTNNEWLDNFRTRYGAELLQRVDGMTAAEAALEINHWLHERVTYAPSDARTSAPEASILNATGRCGEESALAVAAMRAAGIPARQVYTPRWAHTDDNHAWVEVWIDGQWCFLGACEPEPELNRAWFNAPASRGMLMHTRVLGPYSGPEPVMSRQAEATEINVTANYVPTLRQQVTVTDIEGRPLAGVPVQFKIYNYAEFYTVGRDTTDVDGRASIITGRGDLLAWAAADGRFGIAKVSPDSMATLPLAHTPGDTFTLTFDIVPPVENPIPTYATEAQIAENARRLAYEDSLRNAYTATFPAEGDPLYRARGNHRQIARFLQMAERGEEARAMLDLLADKDLRDTPAEVLLDALANTPSDDGTPLFRPYVLSPRISTEMLTPGLRRLTPVSSADEALLRVRALTLDSVSTPYALLIPPAAVDRSGRTDRRSAAVYFVALLRQAGIPARVNEVSGTTQYHDGETWVDVDLFGGGLPQAAPQGYAALSYTPRPGLANPQYYRHFTLSEIADGFPRLMEYAEDAAWGRGTMASALEMAEGAYVLTTGTRLASGGVLASLTFFPVTAGDTTAVALHMRPADGQIAVIGNMDPEALYTTPESTTTSILATTGRGYFLIACLGGSDEPSNHAVLQLAEAADALNAWGRPVLVLKPGAQPRRELDAIARLHYGIDPEGAIAQMLRQGTESSKQTLPVIAVADSFGRIVAITEGYDTSLAERLRTILPQL